MPRPSYKKQKEIERLLIFDAFGDEETPRSWSDLRSAAKEKGLTSPSTLSEYLKRLERARYVSRSIDSRRRPPRATYRLLTGARSRWIVEGPSRVPLMPQLERPATHTAGLEKTIGEHEIMDFLLSTFNPPDEDRVLDSGTLGILARRSTKDQVFFIY